MTFKIGSRQIETATGVKFPGLKLTPGQVTQSMLVKAIMTGQMKQVNKVYKKKNLNSLQVATIYYFLQKFRRERGLDGPTLQD